MKKWIALMILATSLISQVANGTTYYWDTDASTALNNVDGTGLGGSSPTSWDAVWKVHDFGNLGDQKDIYWWAPGAPALTYWANVGSITNGAVQTEADDVVFNGTPGTVKNWGDLKVRSLTVAAGGYTFSSTDYIGNSMLRSVTFDVPGTNRVDFRGGFKPIDAWRQTKECTIYVGADETLATHYWNGGDVPTYVKQGPGLWLGLHDAVSNPNSVRYGDANYRLQNGVYSIDHPKILRYLGGSRASFWMKFEGGTLKIAEDVEAHVALWPQTGSIAKIDVAAGKTYLFGDETNSTTGTTYDRVSTLQSASQSLGSPDAVTAVRKQGAGTLKMKTSYLAQFDKNYYGLWQVEAGTLMVHDDVPNSTYLFVNYYDSAINTATDTFTSSTGNLKENDKIAMVAGNDDATFKKNVVYFAVNVTPNTMRVSATPGGAPLDVLSTNQKIFTRISALGLDRNFRPIQLGTDASADQDVAFLTGALSSSNGLHVERGLNVVAISGNVTIGGSADESCFFSGPVTLGKDIRLTSAAVTGTNAVIFSGAFTGEAVSIHKVGAGFAAFNSTNSTFTGTSTVLEGTLGGIGIIPGPVLVQGGKISAGLAGTTGTLTTQDVTLEATGALAVDLDGAAADLIDVNWNLALGGQLLVNVVSDDPSVKRWPIAQVHDGVISGVFAQAPEGYYASTQGDVLYLIRGSAGGVIIVK